METTVSKGLVFRTILLSGVILFLMLVAEYFAFSFGVSVYHSSDDLMVSLYAELGGALVLVLGVLLLGGRYFVGTSRQDMTYTLHLGWWCLAISLGLAVFSVITYLTDGASLAADWLASVAEVTLFCLCIGVLEEFLFRGIIFQNLLAVMGGTHRGVVRAVIITSVVFGLAHVEASTSLINLNTFVQATCKVVQTGMYSFLLCVIVLRTKQLGGVSLFHGFDDWMLLVVGTGLFSEEFSTEYVDTEDDGYSSILFYLIIIALYLPFVIKAARELKRGNYVTRGQFVEHRMARSSLASTEVSAPLMVPQEPAHEPAHEPLAPLPPDVANPGSPVHARASVPAAPPGGEDLWQPAATPASQASGPSRGRHLAPPVTPSASPSEVLSTQAEAGQGASTSARHLRRPPAPTGL